MKAIKIFLAALDEQKTEHLEMTDLVGRLNQTFKGHWYPSRAEGQTHEQRRM